MSKIKGLSRLGAIAALGALFAFSAVAVAEAAPPVRFEATVSPKVEPGPTTGHVIFVVSTNNDREPRSQITVNGPAIFGAGRDAAAPGTPSVADASSRAYPVADLSALPAGDYYVQAVMIRYGLVHRADGKSIWIPVHHARAPFFGLEGNLYSDVQKVHLDPAQGFDVHFVLDHVIPAPERPKDTPWIKYVSVKSEILSKFWGYPIYLNAYVLLPKGYADHPNAHYPVVFANSHSETPYSFTETPATPEQIAEAKTDNLQTGYDFQKTWTSDNYPRFFAIAPFISSPYFLESYDVDSVNNGPYGEAFTKELVPYLEKTFRIIPKPYARFVQGASTGGWETLALQLKYPDFFGGAWVFNPDPISFAHWQNINIYTEDNLFSVPAGAFLSHERTFRRSVEGQATITQRELAQFEAVQGDHLRSGHQLAIWEASYGPIGDDGYPVPLFDDKTGKIDHKVAEYMRDHGYDLTEYARKNWSTLGPKLSDKLNFISGEMDNFYLNLGVYDFQDMVKDVAGPDYPITFRYGRPKKGHSWHATSFSEMIREMAAAAKKHAPAGEDTAQWNY